ncbi:MAG: beta-lactamase family protein [Actinomycetota bacterium]|nr:beta-lactamase family protein [Actinomycetota bacterium]
MPGAQLAVHHGGRTTAAEVGELEHGTGQAVDRHAAFAIGSITKSFTATVAVILAADEEVELDAPLGEYLPELGDRSGQVSARLTLRQLLSHTSGLPEGPESMDIGASSIRRYVLDHCRGSSVLFLPGTCFSYSNAGYVLVGHLIEVITGMTWWEATASILLRPLGVEPAFLATPDPGPLPRAMATGHSVNPSLDRIRPVEQSLALAEMPCGGLAASAVDLVALGLAHAEGRPGVLPSEYAAQMRRSVPNAEPFGLADGWGLGLAVFHDGGDGDLVGVGHDGNADGTACYLRVEPGGGSVVALTSNANTGLTMWRELVGELRRLGVPLMDYSPAGALRRPAAAPPGCAGSYLNGDSEYSVTEENGDVCLAVDGDLVARLAFYEGLVFSQRDPTSGAQTHAGRFLRDPASGEIDRIQVGGRLARRRSDRDP